MCSSPIATLYPHSFTGGSSNVNKKPRGRPFLVDEYGNMTDMAVIRQQERDAARDVTREKEMERKRKAAARKHKGKQPRVNYKTMILSEYSALRQRNWFDQPRDEDLENRHFWCQQQLGIYEDVYSKMNIRPMRPLDMDHLRSKKEFEVPLAITERM